jgi:RNA polymerase sigma factor (sigma-70 family)
MIDNHFEHINELVNLAQNDDNSAMEELLEFYQPLIKAAIRKYICSDMNLSRYKDDIYSISCIEFTKLVKSFDISRSFFSYYVSNRLYPNIIKACKDLIPKVNSQIIEFTFSEMPKLWDAESPDPFAQIELEILIKDAMEKIKPEFKEAITLIYYDQLTQEEAAESLSLTQSAFSKRLKKSLAALKNNLNFF